VAFSWLCVSDLVRSHAPTRHATRSTEHSLEIRASLVRQLYRAGFDEHVSHLASDRALDASTRLLRVGELWSVCIRYEAAVPAVKSSSVAVEANIRKDQVLLAQARMTCCMVWLDAFEKKRELERKETKGGVCGRAFRQLVAWVMQACDSLVLSRQYLAVGALLERVDMHLVLDDVETAITQGRQAQQAVDDVGTRWVPLVQYAKLVLFKAYTTADADADAGDPSAAMGMARAMGQVQRYVGCVVGVSDQVWCDVACLEVAMRFVYLHLREKRGSGGLLEAVGPLVRRLKANAAAESAVWEMRVAACLLWSGTVPAMSPFVVDGGGDVGASGRSPAADAVVEALRVLDDVEDLESAPDLDACGLATRRLDAIVRENASVSANDPVRDSEVVEAMGMACAALVGSRRGVRSVLVMFATMRRKYAVGRASIEERGVRMFLLSVLGSLCLRLDAGGDDAIEVVEVIAAIVSNRVFLRALQGGESMGLVRDLHALLWNAACDWGTRGAGRELGAIRALLSSALVLAELLQDIDCIRNAVLQLARVETRMTKWEVAAALAARAAEHDALAAMLVKLEIEAFKVGAGAGGADSANLFVVKDIVRSLFEGGGAGGGEIEGGSVPLPLTAQEGVEVVCRLLEDTSLPVDGRRIVSGLVIHGILRHAVSDDEQAAVWRSGQSGRSAAAGPSVVLLLFQNLLELASTTKHPILVESAYAWMRDANGANGANGTTARPAAAGSDARVVPLRYLANTSAWMAVGELRNDDPERAQVAAMFAARTLDLLCELDADAERAKHAVASLVCCILGCHAACLASCLADDAEDMEVDAGMETGLGLGPGLETDRRAWSRRLLGTLHQLHCSSRVAARADAKTTDALAHQTKMAELLIHIEGRQDLLASETLVAIHESTSLDASLLLDLLGRLPQSAMPMTLNKALNMALTALNPDDPAYFDAVRTLLTGELGGGKAGGGLIDQVHDLLSTTPPPTTTTTPPFVEWFYIYAWNAGRRTLALDGMDRHALLTPALR